MAASCYRCGNSLDDLPVPIGRRESCSKCGFDVKVCKNCVHYDINSYNECREPMAERVVDKEKSNTCDYFRLGAGVKESQDAAAAALKRLDDLFKK